MDTVTSSFGTGYNNFSDGNEKPRIHNNRGYHRGRGRGHGCRRGRGRGYIPVKNAII